MINGANEKYEVNNPVSFNTSIQAACLNKILHSGYARQKPSLFTGNFLDFLMRGLGFIIHATANNLYSSAKLIVILFTKLLSLSKFSQPPRNFIQLWLTLNQAPIHQLAFLLFFFFSPYIHLIILFSLSFS